MNEEKAACAVRLPSEPPEWVVLIPAGDLATRDGREPWRNSTPETVVAAAQARGLAELDLVIDYEHQTDFAPKNGQPAPAAGWVRELVVQAGAVVGRVEWTERAAAMIRGGEYRFLSPTFYFDKATRQITRILRAALTNDPALFMKAIARSEEHEDEMNEFLKALCALLGLPEDAGQEKALTAVGELKKTSDGAGEQIAAIAKALGLAEDAAPDTVAAKAGETVKAASGQVKAIAKAAGLDEGAEISAVETKVAALASAAASGRPDPSKYVPLEQHETVANRLKAVEDGIATDKATAAVEKAVADGKLVPAQKDWAMDYARQDLAAFGKWAESQPVVVARGSQTPGGKPARGKNGLTEDELATCSALGMDPEAFKKTRDAEEEEAAR